MSDSPRDELTSLARALAAHVEWQRELGAFGFPPAPPRANVPVMPVARSSERPAQSSERPAAVEPPPAPEPGPPPAAEFELPAFLRRNRPPTSRAVDLSVPAPRPAASEPVATPTAPEPAPAARPLFEEPKPALPDAMSGPVVEGEARHRGLQVIRDAVVGCTSCRLHEQRTQTVFARGNPFAPLAFVGEGPGRDEDLQGAPFVGAAGQLLDKIIGAMGMSEDDVYICNVVKCRPPNNRVPMPDEMATCGPYLVSQLGLVRPQIIVALGKTAAGFLLGSSDSMSRLRGRWHAWHGIPLLPTWHPAYLLRQPSAKKDTWDDMKLVLQRMGKTPPKR